MLNLTGSIKILNNHVFLSFIFLYQPNCGCGRPYISIEPCISVVSTAAPVGRGEPYMYSSIDSEFILR